MIFAAPQSYHPGFPLSHQGAQQQVGVLHYSLCMAAHEKVITMTEKVAGLVLVLSFPLLGFKLVLANNQPEQ